MLKIMLAIGSCLIDRMPTLEVRRDLDDPPTSDKFQRALSILHIVKSPFLGAEITIASLQAANT